VSTLTDGFVLTQIFYQSIPNSTSPQVKKSMFYDKCVLIWVLVAVISISRLSTVAQDAATTAAAAAANQARSSGDSTTRMPEHQQQLSYRQRQLRADRWDFEQEQSNLVKERDSLLIQVNL
jgi:hypothetical protein